MTRKHIDENKNYARAFIGAAFNLNQFSPEVRDFVDYLQRAGARLHTRYEHACNGYSPDHGGYWDERDDAKTEKLERTLLERARDFGLIVTDDVNQQGEHGKVFIRLQGDPRGWPVEIISGQDGYTRTIRLGGKA